MSNFKIIVTAIFSIAIVVGIILFSMSKNSSSAQSANLTVWGTISQNAFNTAYKNSSIAQNKLVQVKYIQKSAPSFDSELVEALADGTGPDLVILRDDSVYKNRNRLLTVPYKSYPITTFKQNFIEESEVFLSPQGIIAFPFLVDPMVMYWNRDIFSNNFVSSPPQYWDEIYAIVNKTTTRDTSANVLRSSIALGGWSNITHAKEIISMLLLQAGTPITSRSSTGVESVLGSQFNYTVPPAQSAVSFYTQFTSPTSPAYTWNRSLPNSFDFFLSGNLALYLGFSSEIFSIQQKNANLNFDVALVPQVRNASKKIVFGHMYVISLVKQSKQVSSAFSLATALTEPSAIKSLEEVTNLPPVRRDLLADKPADSFRGVFYNSALISHTWIDPDSALSNNTFRDMIESITSGANRQNEAISRANDELTAELGK